MKYKLNANVFLKNKVNRKSFYSNQKLYYIFNYDKSVLCYDNIEAATYRSVIFSGASLQVLCFSPTKSLTNAVFVNKYPEINRPEFFVNECIEGVMINLFYDFEIAKWEIATINCIGGRNKPPASPRARMQTPGHPGPTAETTYISSYYHLMGVNLQHENRKTFHQMFLEAFTLEKNKELNDLEWIRELPKSFSYCFVLQHPANKLVVPVKTPKLYLVSVFHIGNHDVEYVPPYEYERWHNLDSRIYFPERKQYYEYEDVYAAAQNAPIHIPGYILTNTQTGEKTKLSNPNYEKVKRSKDISLLLQYQYLCYRRAYNDPVNERWIHKLGKPNKTKKQMLDVNADYEEFIKNVYYAYKNKYVYKSRMPVAEKYETHIYKIHHTIFIPSLRTEKTPITLGIVKEYFNEMEPRELLFIINSDRRKICEGYHR